MEGEGTELLQIFHLFLYYLLLCIDYCLAINMRQSADDILDSYLVGLDEVDRRERAERERLKGNESYRAGDMHEAIAYYTRSIAYKPSVEAYNNRALTRCKLGLYTEAIADCDTVLDTLENPNNVKALVRKATALKGTTRAHTRTLTPMHITRPCGVVSDDRAENSPSSKKIN